MGVDLVGVDLVGVDLVGVDLVGVDFVGVRFGGKTPCRLAWCSGFLHLGQGYLAAKALAIASECAGTITRWNFTLDAGVPRTERICTLCGSEVEDEIHFMLRCPALVNARRHILGECVKLCEDFLLRTDMEKFYFYLIIVMLI